MLTDVVGGGRGVGGNVTKVGGVHEPVFCFLVVRKIEVIYYRHFLLRRGREGRHSVGKRVGLIQCYRRRGEHLYNCDVIGVYEAKRSKCYQYSINSTN